MAARFLVVGGVDTNWGTIGNWSLTSGGAGGQTVPSAADDVTLDANSGSACVLNTSARVAKTLVVNGYTGSITFDQQLSVSGSVTFTTTGFTFAGAATNKLRMIAAGTWTTNGKTIPQNIEIGGTTTFTCTLAGALVTSGDLLLSNTTSTIFSGAFEITAAGNCTIQGSQTLTCVENVNIGGTTTSADACVANGAFQWRTGGLTTTGNLSGTMLVAFTGTGTWTGAAGALSNSVTYSATANLTLSGTILYNTGTMTNAGGGTITPGASILALSTCTLNTAGITFATVRIASAATTLTINSLLTAATLALQNAAATFAGTVGWTVGTLTTATDPGTTRITTFGAGLTYTVTAAFTMGHANAQTTRFTFTAASTAFFILGPGATQSVGFVDPTNLDASGGQAIYSYTGVVTTSPNWSAVIPAGLQRLEPVYQLGI